MICKKTFTRSWIEPCTDLTLTSTRNNSCTYSWSCQEPCMNQNLGISDFCRYITFKRIKIIFVPEKSTFSQNWKKMPQKSTNFFPRKSKIFPRIEKKTIIFIKIALFFKLILIILLFKWKIYLLFICITFIEN